MCCGKKPVSRLKRTKSGLKKGQQSQNNSTAPPIGEPKIDNNAILPKKQNNSNYSILLPPYGVHYV